MSTRQDDQQYRDYYIPPNIFDGASLFSIKARNWVEAAIFSFLPGFLFWRNVHLSDMSIKVILMLAVCVPIAAFALIGYNGESLTQFVKTYYKFRQNRRVLTYTIPDEDEEFGDDNPFSEMEGAIDELKLLIKDTNDKREMRSLKAELRRLTKELATEKAEQRKKDAEADARNRKARQERRAAEIKQADEMAAAEIRRLKEAGEKKINKKAIQQKYRDEMVMELPAPPKSNKGANRNLCAQDFIPIDRIEDRCIITKGGRYIRILCVAPINFPMLAADQQNYVIDNFAILLKGSPVNVHIKTMAKSADVEGFIEKVQEKMDKEESPECRILMEDYINTLRKNATQNAVSRQFFYIIEYDEGAAHKNTTDRDRKTALESACQKAKQYFRRCNNTVYEFASESDEVDFIYRMFYDLLDRFNAFGMSYFDKVDYAYQQVSSVPGRVVTAGDFISPLSIDLSNRKYVVVDGVYYGYMYIPTRGYRNQVWGSWLFGAINAGGGIDVDIFYERGDKDKVRSATRRQINLSTAQLHGSRTNTDDFDALANKTQGAQYIKNGLSSNEDFFYVTTIITVIAMSENALYQRMAGLSSLFDDMDMRVLGCDFHQEEAFLATLPLCKCAPSIYDMGRRNMLTHDAAATYPFSSYELMDDNGILVGTNLTNGSLVMPDPFDTKKYKNANQYELGSSGAGKSYLLLTSALRSRIMGIQTFILAPLKGFEMRRSCEAAGGQYIKISPGSAHCINIMQIRKRDEEAVAINRLLDGSEDDSILSEKISSLETLFAIMIPDITNEEEQLVNGHIMETYKGFGITTDNDSLWDPENPEEYRYMPTLADLYKHMEGDPHMERVRNIMSKYVTGSAKNFSQQTNVNLDNMYTVIDVSSLNKKMMPIGMFIALDFFWDKIKEDRTKPKRLFIDEIWHLMGAGAPIISAEFCQEIFKTCRSFGCGSVAVSQELLDFFALNGGTYGRAILNACTIGMILKTENTELKLLKENLDLEQREIDIIQSFEKGQALIIGGGNSVAVKVVASPLLHRLITTDQEDLRRIAREQKAKEELEAENLLAVEQKDEMTPGEILAASRRQAPRPAPVSRRRIKL